MGLSFLTRSNVQNIYSKITIVTHVLGKSSGGRWSASFSDRSSCFVMTNPKVEILPALCAVRVLYVCVCARCVGHDLLSALSAQRR